MAHSDTDATTDHWADTDLGPEAVLGTTTFEGVLYTEQKATQQIPVDVRSGEKVAEAPTAEQARAMAERTDISDLPYVAVATGTETMADVRAGPVTRVVFCNYKLVGGLDQHKAYTAAYRDPDYHVTVDADYETGDLTITVEEATDE